MSQKVFQKAQIIFCNITGLVNTGKFSDQLFSMPEKDFTYAQISWPKSSMDSSKGLTA